MARRWRRRRSTQVWMPTYGNVNDVDNLSSVIGTAGNVPVSTLYDITVDAFACTFDDTQNPFFVQFQASPNTLHDLVAGQEWRLLRVVGKFHAQYVAPYGGSDPAYYSPPAVEVALGLIVMRTDEEGNILADLDEVNPLAQESANDPWIFRRKWILSNTSSSPLATIATPPGATPGTALEAQWRAGRNWPLSTAGYGSVADGPHIDQKTRRLIGREERLMWMIATRAWDPGHLFRAFAPFNNGGVVYYNLDNRFVGRLSSKMGNRNNASR